MNIQIEELTTKIGEAPSCNFSHAMSAPTMNPEQRFLNSLLLFLLFQSCTSINTITSNKTISDGDLLVSNGKNFSLGFFSPGNSSNRYVGIWYNKVSPQTVVWVANRDNPIYDTDGILSITKQGNLLLSAGDIVFWSSNVSDTSMKNCVAQLLDTGNLILIQSITEKVIWQSFDYPTDTFLPNMKLGLNRRAGFNMFLTSWKSPDDPGTGDSLYRFDENGYPQLVLFKGLVRLWRTGPWNGYRWSGVPQMNQNFIFNSSFVDNHDELYLTFGIRNTSIFTRMVLNESSSLHWLTWHEGDRRWIEYYSAPKERCDNYGQCGWNGNCNPYTADEFECTCLPGYEPKSPRDWYLRDGLEGCVRKRAAASTCRKGDGFVKLEHVKVPDTSTARVERSMSLKACEEECLRNCTCTAYTSANISGGGNGCVSWHADLIDTSVYSNAGQDLFIRVDALVLAQYVKKSKRKTTMVAILVLSGAIILLLAVFLLYWLVSKRKRGKEGRSNVLINVATNSTSFKGSQGEMGLDEGRIDKNLHLFELRTIVAATDNFSFANKLGQGGFGFVYKGCLVNGQEIAVKRLSKNSGQGIEEFKNEVRLIAKLQHMNLVRLLGCCIHKEEQMLIYEYLPNKSLDYFIFDKTRTTLDWRKRFEIIFGIARGVLYLHEDSRLKIIHRDLKASNVLLDAAMNPKISDFGLARIFGVDQIEASTNRVVGTYGYMAPEYAMEGLYSIKSDVFSFGVLLLEIISGRKNTGYNLDSPALNLIGHMWDLWREEKALDIVDSSLAQPCPSHEVLRCIQIGLLCVQECAADRPTMLGVILMLGNETPLLSPKQPAFIFNRQDPSKAEAVACSVNEVTLTSVNGR